MQPTNTPSTTFPSALDAATARIQSALVRHVARAQAQEAAALRAGNAAAARAAKRAAAAAMADLRAILG